MKDIIVSVLVLSMITTIARLILPRVEIFVKWLIKKFVGYAEKKVKGSGLGLVKKNRVLKWLRWFGIKSNDFVDEFINATVEVMNSKGCDIKTDIQTTIVDGATDKLKNATEKVVNK